MGQPLRISAGRLWRHVSNVPPATNAGGVHVERGDFPAQEPPALGCADSGVFRHPLPERDYPCSWTALLCNQQFGREGGFWQPEPDDHWVRGPEELYRILLSIEGNPVKAGLVQSPHEWRHSSAWERRQRGLELGQPLTRPKLASWVVAAR